MKICILPLLFLLQVQILIGQQAPNTIQEKFGPHFLIGTAVNNRQINENKEQADLIAAEFNILTAENVMKSKYLHPTVDVFNFEDADKLFALAAKNKQKVHGHTLVWHSQNSPFFEVLQDSALMAKTLERHIETIVGRYKGQVYSWDVVNEAVENDGTLRLSVFLQTMGEDYLPFAFDIASKIDPKADLYYNDYSMTLPAKREGVIKMVKRIQELGIKIDGIGMQGHWHLETPSIAEIEESILAYGKLGLKIAITELDIDVLPSPKGISGAEISQNAEQMASLNPYSNGLPKEIEEAQANRYAELFALFYKHRDKIDRVTFWGVNDGNSWKNNFPVRGRTNYPLLFDRNNQRKAAYNAIMALDLH